MPRRVLAGVAVCLVKRLRLAQAVRTPKGTAPARCDELQVRAGQARASHHSLIITNSARMERRWLARPRCPLGAPGRPHQHATATNRSAKSPQKLPAPQRSHPTHHTPGACRFLYVCSYISGVSSSVRALSRALVLLSLICPPCWTLCSQTIRSQCPHSNVPVGPFPTLEAGTRRSSNTRTALSTPMMPPPACDTGAAIAIDHPSTPVPIHVSLSPLEPISHP